MDKYNEYKLQQSEAIQEAYNLIKLHFSFSLLDEVEKDWLEAIPLTFHNKEFSGYAALAYKKERDIGYNINSTYTSRFSRTLIHEIAHIICFECISEKMGHTLEFAIINYCLLHSYMPEVRNFFDSYDIHEDECYKWISVCPAQFDDFILSIKFDTLRELVKRAKFLAMKIRDKQAFFTITQWRKEFEQYEQYK